MSLLVSQQAQILRHLEPTVTLNTRAAFEALVTGAPPPALGAELTRRVAAVFVRVKPLVRPARRFVRVR